MNFIVVLVVLLVLVVIGIIVTLYIKKYRRTNIKYSGDNEIEGSTTVVDEDENDCTLPTNMIPCKVKGVLVNTPWYRLDDSTEVCYAPRCKISQSSLSCCVVNDVGMCIKDFSNGSVNDITTWLKSCKFSYDDSGVILDSKGQSVSKETETVNEIREPTEMKCENGAHVTKIFGQSGKYIDSIGIGCSDGKTFTQFGGNGGNFYTSSSEGGFKKIGVKYGDYVDNISLYDSSNTNIFSTGGGGGKNSKSLECPSKITGISVGTMSIGLGGEYLHGLKAYC